MNNHLSEREAYPLVYFNYESLGAELIEQNEERDTQTDCAELPLLDELTPYRPVRVASYAGTPGSRTSCPGCAFTENRVDGWGGFTCENCGFTNLEERPLPWRNGRRPRRDH